jgi:formate dehydrogenase
MTAERIAKSKKLRLIITAGIGSDHTDLQSAIDNKITVTEVTSSSSNAVAEHIVMSILIMVRNFIPSHSCILNGGWNIADCVSRSYDLESMTVGSVAAGRTGLRVLRLLKPFGVRLHYMDRYRLPMLDELELNLTYHSSFETLARVCDVITLNCPLHPETEYMINRETLKYFKRGAYLVNTARGKLCDPDAIVEALKNGHLAGYAGDVWFPQPPHKDHPWRDMPHHAMTPNIAGCSLSSQTRYAAGVREILECYFENRPIRSEYLIAQGGHLVGTGAYSYSLAKAAGSSEKSNS